MGKLVKEAKALFLGLVVFLTFSCLFYFVFSGLGLFHGELLEFCGRALLGLAVVIALTLPSFLKSQRLEKAQIDAATRMAVIPSEAKFCSNCQYRVVSNDEYQCSKISSMGKLDAYYCCVRWDPDEKIWSKLLQLELK